MQGSGSFSQGNYWLIGSVYNCIKGSAEAEPFTYNFFAFRIHYSKTLPEVSMPTPRRRSAALPILLFLACTALLWIAAGLLRDDPEGIFAPHASASASADPEKSPAPTPPPLTCVVIDAGHGGEDGGASSADGVVEKEVNLAVAFALRDLCEAAGIPVVMTRTQDTLLYDRNIDYQGRKKVLDLAARRLVAEETPNCLFVSIHMNAFPQPQYSGMQVWYGVADSRSVEIAMAIQTASRTLMPENHREIKAAGSNIYLLDRIQTPAVLVECGFLSNPAEAARLADEGYQRALAAVIFSAVAPYVTP